MSEAGSGSDVVSIRTRAERDNDHYVLNGSKLKVQVDYSIFDYSVDY